MGESIIHTIMFHSYHYNLCNCTLILEQLWCNRKCHWLILPLFIQCPSRNWIYVILNMCIENSLGALENKILTLATGHKTTCHWVESTLSSQLIVVTHLPWPVTHHSSYTFLQLPLIRSPFSTIHPTSKIHLPFTIYPSSSVHHPSIPVPIPSLIPNPTLHLIPFLSTQPNAIHPINATPPHPMPPHPYQTHSTPPRPTSPNPTHPYPANQSYLNIKTSMII